MNSLSSRIKTDRNKSSQQGDSFKRNFAMESRQSFWQGIRKHAVLNLVSVVLIAMLAIVALPILAGGGISGLWTEDGVTVRGLASAAVIFMLWRIHAMRADDDPIKGLGRKLYDLL